jgi:hypothetical protein
MMALSYSVLSELCDSNLGTRDVPCPFCGPDRRAPGNRKRRVFRVWHSEPGFASFHCVRCGERGWANEGSFKVAGANKLQELRLAVADRHREHAARQGIKARWLWRRRKPIAGSPVETYLKKARCYCGPLLGTLGFLPPAKRDHHPAMMAAFGVPKEMEPGLVEIRDDEVQGVHLTLVKLDGSDKAGTDRDKIMIGPSSGWPIVLAPMNNLLGLAICEGIESGLSIYEATGLGVWAAGSAGRMPALAKEVPAYADCVTIVSEADQAGQAGTVALARILTARGLHCETRLLDTEASAA